MKQFASLQATVRTQQTALTSLRKTASSPQKQFKEFQERAEIEEKEKDVAYDEKTGVAKTMTGIHGREIRGWRKRDPSKRKSELVTA